MDGTLEFMAPEVVSATFATTATDMWSLGWVPILTSLSVGLITVCRVLLYMLGSGGNSPFWAGSSFKTQKKILKGKFSLKLKAFEVLSDSCRNLIKK